VLIQVLVNPRSNRSVPEILSAVSGCSADLEGGMACRAADRHHRIIAAALRHTLAYAAVVTSLG